MSNAKNILITIVTVLATMFLVEHWILFFVLSWFSIGFFAAKIENKISCYEFDLFYYVGYSLVGPIAILIVINNFNFNRFTKTALKFFIKKEFDIKLQWPIVIKEKNKE